MIDRRTLLQGVAASAVVAGLGGHTASSDAQTPRSRRGRSGTSIGRTRISTVPLDPRYTLLTATYTSSGRVLVQYSESQDSDSGRVNLAIMDDDGANFRPFFSQALPEVHGGNGIRFMMFPDNRRILLGDFIIECEPSIDNCREARLLPLQYPAEVAEGSHIGHRWSEIAVAPDNRHIGWNALLTSGGVAVFVGDLRRGSSSYTIANTQIISSLRAFDRDPAHPDGMVPLPMRGGEVKQFVRGGTAMSLVGAGGRELPDSVLQTFATGTVQPVTSTAGYTETTIFSPDERFGITMTARFSPASDLAVIGLMPRPYHSNMSMGISGIAYGYSVSSVRRSRRGNIGPALIDIHASMTQPDYMGVNLNTDESWVFNSPMSWHPSSRKAMWIESQRGGQGRRIQTVELLDRRPGRPVAAQTTPDNIPYAERDLGAVERFVRQGSNVDVKVYGRRSGYITYRRQAGLTEKRYHEFSDDGATTYDGSERMDFRNPANPVYTADVRCIGRHSGRMDLQLSFTRSAREFFGAVGLDFQADASGRPASRGFAEYDGRRLEVSALLP